MKKVLSMILAIALMISIVPTGLLNITASAESTVVNIYNLAAFNEALVSENTDIILWQDIVVPNSVTASCNSIDLNGNNLAINSNFKIENNDGSFKIFDSKYNKNTQTSSGSAAFSKGIDIGRSTLIVESGVITIHGENGYNGSDGTKSGSSGGNGAYGSDGIYGTGDLIFNNGFINISGGNGGQGGNGARGYHSSDQSYYYDTFGLPHLLSLCSWFYRNAGFTTYLSDGTTADAIRNFILTGEDNFDEARLPISEVKEGVFYCDENITVEAIPTDHICGVHPSYAFLIEGEGKRILFTGDMHADDPADFPKVAFSKPTDAIVCELVHFRPEKIIEKLERCPTKQVIFNHYHETWALEAIKQMKLPFPTVAAKDGEEVIL